MGNFDLNELIVAEAYVGLMIDAIYHRLMDRDFALEDPEVVMLLIALINILAHDNRGERGVIILSGSDLANQPGLGSSRTYQPGEMPLPTKPRPGLRRLHQEMNSESALSSSQLRAAVPTKRARKKKKFRRMKRCRI